MVGIMFALGSGAEAQERGIGVSPARIEQEDIAEWPYTTALLVTNYSDEKELYEVKVKASDAGIFINPGRFVLNPGETGRALISFEQKAEGMLRVSAVKTSAEGLVTGTGMEVPFQVQQGSGFSNQTSLGKGALAAVGSGDGIPWSGVGLGIMILLGSVFALWKASFLIGAFIWKK